MFVILCRKSSDTTEEFSPKESTSYFITGSDISVKGFVLTNENIVGAYVGGSLKE